jgi:hypothetical protein
VLDIESAKVHQCIITKAITKNNINGIRTRAIEKTIIFKIHLGWKKILDFFSFFTQIGQNITARFKRKVYLAIVR